MIFAVWAVTVAGVRSSLRSVVSTLLSPKLLGLLATVIGANALAVWLLWREGRWDATMLYDTVLFVAIGGIGSVSRAATQGATYDGSFFYKTVIVNLEVTVFVGFVMDLFPLNFWVEFLAVVPLATLLTMLMVVSEHQKDGAQVHRLFTGAQSFIGVLLVGYAASQLITQWGHLMQSQLVASLTLPLVMSILFVPTLFAACTLFAYEDAFLVVSFKSGDQKRTGRWKKWRLFRRFGLSLVALQSFRRSPLIHEYAWVKTMAEAEAILKSWSRVESPDGAAFWRTGRG